MSEVNGAAVDESKISIPLVLQVPAHPVSAEQAKFLEELRSLADEIRKGVADLLEAITQQPSLSWSEVEAAEILGMSLTTLQRERRNGGISYTRVAGRARYTRTHLEDYLARYTVKAGR